MPSRISLFFYCLFTTLVFQDNASGFGKTRQPSSEAMTSVEWTRQVSIHQYRMRWSGFVQGLVDGFLGPLVVFKSIYVDKRPYRGLSFRESLITLMPPYGSIPRAPYFIGFISSCLGMCLALIRVSANEGYRWLGELGLAYYIIYMLFVTCSLYFYAVAHPI